MIKKSIYFVGLIVAFLLTACTAKVDDIFGENASDRISERLTADKAVLTGAENGWLMEYFPSKSFSFGGYNVLVKFGEGENVTIASELGEPSETETTTYTLKEQAGPVLTFDTYNRLFHPYSDPVNDFGMGDTGLGMEGDYEFLIMEATADKVVMKGKKTGNKIVMTPLPAGQNWADYMTKLKTSSESIEKYFSFNYAITGIDFEAARQYRTLNITMESESGESETTLHAYIPTVDGFKLYEPADFFGVQAQVFKDTGNDQWTSEDGMVKVKGNTPSNVDVFMNYGPWFLTYANMTGETTRSTFLNNYDKMFGEGGVFEGCSLKYFGFGANIAYSNYGLQLISSDWDPNLDDDSYAANVALVGVTGVRVPGSDDMVSLYIDSQTAMATEAGGKMLNTGIVSFFADLSSTKLFRLKADNVYRPTKITLTDTEDAKNVFTLVLSEEQFGYVPAAE